MPLLDDAPDDIIQLAKDWNLTYKISAPINGNIVVAGAYTGKLMDLLHRLFPTTKIYGFEPQLWAYERAKDRLAPIDEGLNWWSLANYGLGIKDNYLPMGEYYTDAASFINTNSRESGFGFLMEFFGALKFHSISYIDLFVLNTEGYEWELLPYLIDRGFLPCINQFVIQFHEFDNKDSSILDRIDETHNRKIDDYPTWVLWERKNA